MGDLTLDRCSPFSGGAVTQAAKECISLTSQLLASLKGNLDVIISKMNEFNVASRTAHAEMLGLSATEQGAPTDAAHTVRRWLRRLTLTRRTRS